MKLGFGSGAYKLGESEEYSAQRMVNCYVEQTSPGADTPIINRQRYGISTFSTFGNGNVRGGGQVRGTLYVVIGTSAYSVLSNGSGTVLGTIPGGGQVQVVGDETNVAFLADQKIYHWNGATLAQVTDADAPRTDWIAVIDGYYVGSNSETGQFYVSDNRNPALWNALDFASAEKYPDNIVSGIVDHGELILFGKDSGEVWYNSGNADFPIEKVPSGHFEIGCLSARSPAKLDNTVYFVGSDGVVYKLNGYTPERVSTHAIESKIRAASDRVFIGHAWAEGGHKIYSITCQDFTLCYDVATQLWHERNSYGLNYWKPCFFASVYDRVLVGDSASSKLGFLDADTVTDWGDVMRSSGTCQLVANDNKRVFHSRLELIFENGMGTLTEADPMVMLRFSDDRGRTWSSEKWRSLGAQGEYQSRAQWHRLGSSRGRIYEYAITSPVRRTLISASLEIEAGGY